MTSDLFVAVPSYRDPSVVRSIDTLRAKADCPVRFGVCLQDDDDATRQALLDMPDVDVVHLRAKEARGGYLSRGLSVGTFGPVNRGACRSTRMLRGLVRVGTPN